MEEDKVGLMTPTEKENMVIRKLLLKGRVKANTVPKDTLTSWFSEKVDDIADTIDAMVADPDVPISTYGRHQEIRLVGVKSAVNYLHDNGDEVPSNLETHLDDTR